MFSLIGFQPFNWSRKLLSFGSTNVICGKGNPLTVCLFNILFLICLTSSLPAWTPIRKTSRRFIFDATLSWVPVCKPFKISFPIVFRDFFPNFSKNSECLFLPCRTFVEYRVKFQLCYQMKFAKEGSWFTQMTLSSRNVTKFSTFAC